MSATIAVPSREAFSPAGSTLFPLVAGPFVPSVAVILRTAPVLLPFLVSAEFDPSWFAVIPSFNLEIGLITPPVGLAPFVID